MDRKDQLGIKEDGLHICVFYDEEEKIFKVPFREDYKPKPFNGFVAIPLKLHINKKE